MKRFSALLESLGTLGIHESMSEESDYPMQIYAKVVKGIGKVTFPSSCLREKESFQVGAEDEFQSQGAHPPLASKTV